MRKSIIHTPKSRGQTMVEFALALPILLIIVFGMIEVGRLIFVYGSVVTASREAVRYGSATGVNSGGTPRFKDCAGIRSAGEMMGFINDITIAIAYENPSQTGCPAGATVEDAINDPDSTNKPRLVVTASSNYQPVVPLVPMSSFTITAVSRRTILGTIYIRK